MWITMHFVVLTDLSTYSQALSLLLLYILNKNK